MHGSLRLSSLGWRLGWFGFAGLALALMGCGSRSSARDATAESNAQAPVDATQASGLRQPPATLEPGADDTGVEANASPASPAGAAGTMNAGTRDAHGRELCSFRPMLEPSDLDWSDRGNLFLDALTPEDLAGLLQIGTDGNVVFAIGGAAVASENDDGLGSAHRNLLVGKLTPQCELLWSRRFDADPTGGMWTTGLAIDSQANIVLSGTFYKTVEFGPNRFSGDRGQLFAVSLEPGGDVRWARQFGSTQLSAPDAYPSVSAKLSLGPNDEVYVYGSSWSIDDLGKTSFAATVPDCGENDTPTSFAACGYLMAMDAGGERQWSRRLSGSSWLTSVAVDHAGAIVFSAASHLDWTDGSSDTGSYLLAKLDSATQRVWSTVVAGEMLDRDRFGGMDWHWDRSLAIDAENNILYLHQEHDGTEPEALGLKTEPGAWKVHKFSPDGKRAWSAGAAAWQGSTPASIAATSGLHSVVAGHFAGTANFGKSALQAQGERDGFVVELDADGEVVWALRYGQDQGDWLGAVATDAGGNVWVAGWSGESKPSEMTAAGLPGTRVTRHAAFITKLSP